MSDYTFPHVVLVVDDEEANRLTYSEMLKRCGFVVAQAANAVEGLTILEGLEVDAVLSDLDLPLVHGLVFAGAIRSRWPNKAIVLMSGGECPPQSAMPSGAKFIAKPFLRAQLAETITQLLADRPRREDG